MNSLYRTIRSKYRNSIDIDEYFNTFLVTPSNVANIQTELNNRGAIRFTDGDYSSMGNITIDSDQKILGYHSHTVLGGTITIKEGASNVWIENVKADEIIFEAGNEITNCTLKGLFITDITTVGGKITNCDFIDNYRTPVFFDCSSAGYFRNNNFLRLVTQSTFPQGEMRGNSVEPSYGNIELFRNILISQGDGAAYYGMEDHTIIGLDMETWNYTNQGILGGLYMRDMGIVKLASTNIYHQVLANNTLPALDIEADTFIFPASRLLREEPTNPSIVREDTDMITLYNRDTIPDLENSETSFEVNFMKHLDREVLINGADNTGLLSNPNTNKVKEFLQRPQGEKVNFEKNEEYLIEAVGIDWETRRIGKTDQSSYIQNLIDTDNIAELGEGVYYISQPLNVGDEKGIVGKGMAKTAIVGITDDFPLIQYIADTSGGNITDVQLFITNLSLYGGNTGLYISKIGSNRLQLTRLRLANLLFYNMDYGFHIKEFFGIDNNYFENLTFKGNSSGFFQEPDPSYDIGQGETNEMMYMDKTLFHNCKFLDCNIGYNALTIRPNVNNMFLDCHFNGNDSNVQFSNHTNFVIVDTTFENTKGDYVLQGANLNLISLYGCIIRNNPSSNTIFHQIRRVFLEDCNIEDNILLMQSGTERQLMSNNSILPDTMDEVYDGILSNCTVTGNTSASKKLVKISTGSFSTLIDEVSDPYPQYLIRYNDNITETVNTYDFTLDNHGITYARQTAVNADVTEPFPTSFSPILDNSNNQIMQRRNVPSPSGGAGFEFVVPQSAGNYFIYNEGTGLADDGNSDQWRYCVLMPKSYKRERGLKFSVMVSLTREVPLDPRIRLYYRNTGGDETTWLLADSGLITTGITEWQNWTGRIEAGDPIDLMFVIQNDARINTWPNKAYFDNALDDIVITETEIV